MAGFSRYLTIIGISFKGIVAALALGAVLSALLTRPAVIAAEEDGQCLSPETYDIKVRVENLRSFDGLLTVELYNDDPEGFIKKSGRLKRIRLSLENSGQIACLKAPGPGTYAVVLYHDENANRKFDKGFLGIPIEGFGISRNPPIGFGAPDLEEASFSLDGEPVILDIKMNYL